jgi:hypothetical protein
VPRSARSPQDSRKSQPSSLEPLCGCDPQRSCLDADPDGDGARWVHPTATAKWSATIRHGLLFAYSTNTPFAVTEAGNAKGYTKFRAHAVLNHDGDLSAAARALKGVA